MAEIYGFRTSQDQAGSYGPQSPPTNARDEVLRRLALLPSGAFDPHGPRDCGNAQPLSVAEVSQGWGGGVHHRRQAGVPGLDMTVPDFPRRALAVYGPSLKRYSRLMWMVNRIRVGDFLLLPHVPRGHHVFFVRVRAHPNATSAATPAYRWADPDVFDLNHRLAVTLPRDPALATFPYGHPALHGTGLGSQRGRVAIWHARQLRCAGAEGTDNDLLAQQLDHAFGLGLGLPRPSAVASSWTPCGALRASVQAGIEQHARQALEQTLTRMSPAEFERVLADYFEEIGYSVIARNQYDGRGGDFDLVLERGADLVSPEEYVAVQAKQQPGVMDVRAAASQLRLMADGWNRQHPEQAVQRLWIVTTASQCSSTDALTGPPEIGLVRLPQLVDALLEALYVDVE